MQTFFSALLAPRWQAVTVFTAVGFFLSLVLSLAVRTSDGNLLASAFLVLLPTACALVWSLLVWNPLWRRLAQEPLPGVFKVVIMGLAGMVLSVLLALIGLLDSGFIVFAWIAGPLASLCGVLGALVLMGLRSKGLLR